jgi:hypothetical protein
MPVELESAPIESRASAVVRSASRVEELIRSF